MTTKADLSGILPVGKSDRVVILDILRGFAIFGILAVNIYGFATPIFLPGYIPPVIAGADNIAQNLMMFFAEGKFYVIFSFLFGLGFSLQLSRAEAKGISIRSFYPRRLGWLFLFGLLHAAFLFIGDILRIYALLGFVLLAFRRCTDRTLLIWAGVFFSLNFLIIGALGGPAGGGEEIPGMDIVLMARSVYNGTAFFPVLAFQTAGSIFSFVIIALAQGGTVMALFLAGMVVGRHKYLEKLPEYRPQLIRIAIAGLFLGLIFNSIFVFSTNPWLISLGFVLGSLTLASAYCSGLCLFSLKALGQRLLTPISRVGRMALTNYIMQSVICAFIFNGYGLGMYEKIGAAGLWGNVFAIYFCQIIFSTIWLSRFRFGPLEWFWRALTYRQRQLG